MERQRISNLKQRRTRPQRVKGDPSPRKSTPKQRLNPSNMASSEGFSQIPARKPCSSAKQSPLRYSDKFELTQKKKISILRRYLNPDSASIFNNQNQIKRPKKGQKRPTSKKSVVSSRNSVSPNSSRQLSPRGNKPTHRRVCSGVVEITQSRPNSNGRGSDSEETVQLPKRGHHKSNSEIVHQIGSYVDKEECQQLTKFISSHFHKYKEAPPTTLEFYNIGGLIGKGAFGKVISATHKLSGEMVAIKTIEKAYMKDERHKRKVFQEVFILKRIRHKSVIRILEVFESTNHMLLVMEYAAGGDLLAYVKERGRLSESESRLLFKQIVEGAQVIHNHGVLHRDFKLDNILLNENYTQIKVCDFGVSKIMKKGQRINEQCGTPAYLAPEIIAEQEYEGFTVDIWSMGILLYAMLTGTVPFKANSLPELQKVILKGTFHLPEHLSNEAQDLIVRMLQLLPNNRIPLKDILRHPWICASETLSRETFAFRFTESTVKEFENPEDRIEEDIVRQVVACGYPKEYVVSSLRFHDLNHATATYYLLRKFAYR